MDVDGKMIEECTSKWPGGKQYELMAWAKGKLQAERDGKLKASWSEFERRALEMIATGSHLEDVLTFGPTDYEVAIRKGKP